MQEATMTHTNAPIVVGVDDTEAARAALFLAMREATRRGIALDVVTAWTAHPFPGDDDGVSHAESDRAHAQDVQDLAVADALRGMSCSPTLSRQVVEGDAASVLLTLARRAAYLVVGAGRGAIGEPGVLGSVAAQCVRAARCPVLVVPRPPAISATKG
jgi:nucleotide-binding universal stress UspA family protein